MAHFLRLLRGWCPAKGVYAALAGAGLLATGGYLWMRAAGVALAVALGGCAALPSQIERPVSHAQAVDATTRLARVVASSTPAATQGLSGLRLLADGEEAFQVRLALIRRAQSSLDVQYYQIANDRTGLEFLSTLRDAAARGVRVRVLVDDLNAAGEDGLFFSLAALPNLEVRMFNPLPVRGDQFGMRIALSLHQFSRINHRMHNKLFVVDGSLAIVGGRNIADEYFDRGEHANFIDADALLCGPVIGQLEALFDSFWNSVYAYPIQALVRPGTEATNTRLDAPSAAPPNGDDPIRLDVPGELAAGRVDFSFGSTEVFADDPSKVGGDGQSEGSPSIGTRELIERARSRAFVSSPYLIPGANDMASLAKARHAGVDVQILTNSLQSTDEPLVYVGFARHANALAGLGVDVREVRGDDQSSSSRLVAVTSRLGASLSRLHAKLLVVDGRWSSIGSFNLDRRSALWNTELVVHADCVPFAHQLEDWAESRVAPSASIAHGTSDSPSADDTPRIHDAPARRSSVRWWQRAVVALVHENQL